MDPVNCSPIILLSIISKVMESINAVDMKSFLFSNNPISDHQFGFRPGHITLDMLLLLTQQWMEALNVRHDIRAISLDISHAFDAVWHLALHSKLSAFSNDTHGLFTSSTLVANVWLSMESFHLLFLPKLECPKAVFWTKSSSWSSSMISLTL